MANLIFALWALIVAFAIYGFGLSGIAATLLPKPLTADTAISAIPAWLILVGLPFPAIWLKRRKAQAV
ncbi:hypothetical protein [Sphingomonas prati]|uniref:Uncharacterized protein n=2 Tax=Sphingomonas prati TaxID=1843237 RepID=A0A7W9BVP3_9SPHN|nr:hypothetical protein [Sphingomonas prati]MBB5730950.1 hypothetical protein [Sphingomonas prati]